jgi:hypothetical protein
MKAFRVRLALLALVAAPVVAQGQGRAKDCKPQQQAVIDRAVAEGRSAPPGLDKKCSSIPDPNTPPTGVNFATGTVYADLDADGKYDPFAGDTVFAGWQVQLLWNNAVVATKTTDAAGSYRFDGLGNTGTASWVLCVVVEPGFVQGPPQGGGYTGCGGKGYAFAFNSSAASMFTGDFGMLAP